MKFFIISYHGDARGHRLSTQLAMQFSEYVKLNYEYSVEGPWTNPPAIENGYTLYHYNSRSFFQKELHKELTLPKKFNPLIHPDADRLDPDKYNIVITHAYSNEKIQIIKEFFKDHKIIICGITYTKDNIEYLVNRNYSLKNNLDKQELYIYYNDYLDIPTSHDITISLDRLISDEEFIDLTDIYEYIKEKQ